jgi:flagellar basal body-associated protein FliL
MTAAAGTTDEPRATRAELQAQRAAARREPARDRDDPGGRGGSRANTILAVLTVVFVVAAGALGALAFTTYSEAQDTRAATRPLEARVASLDRELSESDVAIDRLTALFLLIRAQSDATKAAVDATNAAAAQYNHAEAGIADALGADAANTLAALAQATTAVRTSADDARTALAALGSSRG